MPIIRLSPLTHLLSFVAAVLIGGVTFWSTAATAATGGYYRAQLASPAPDDKFVARDVVWSCEGSECVAGRGNSRPVFMCAALVKEVGPVTGFTAGGKALDAAELARCNDAG